MLNKLLVIFANTFLWAYVLDGVVSLLASMGGQSEYAETLLAARNSIAVLVMFLAVVFLLAQFAFRRVRLWYLFFLVLSVYWLNNSAQPVGLLLQPIAPASLDTAIVSVQVLIGLLAVMRTRQLYGRWTIPVDALRLATTSVWRWLGELVAFLLLTLTLIILYAPFSAVSLMENLSGNYVVFSTKGVHTKEVKFIKQGGPDVRLVGMMHLGASSAYSDLLNSFVADSTLVLEEGVGDRTKSSRRTDPCRSNEQVKQGDLISQPSMCAIPGAARVEAFDDAVGGEWIDLLNADKDMQDMSQETQDWLAENGGLLKQVLGDQSERLNWRLLLAQLSRSIPDVVWEDILYGRNDTVLAAFSATEANYRHIIIPWGAMHAPGIEAELLRMGYVEQKSLYRLMLPWKNLVSKNKSSASGFSEPNEENQQESAAELEESANY